MLYTDQIMMTLPFCQGPNISDELWSVQKLLPLKQRPVQGTVDILKCKDQT